MTSDEWKAFLNSITETMKSNSAIEQINITDKKFQEFFHVVAETANRTVKSIDWDALRHTLSTLADILASIPDDVKETALFQEIDKFSKYKEYELNYENIEWFLEASPD